MVVKGMVGKRQKVWDSQKPSCRSRDKYRPYGCKSEGSHGQICHRTIVVQSSITVTCMYVNVRQQTRTMISSRRDTCRRVQVFDTKIIISHWNSSLTVRFSSTWSGNCLCLSSLQELFLPDLITSTSSGIFWVCNMIFFTLLFDER